MLTEIVQFVGATAVALVVVGTLRVVADLLTNGEGRVREVREEGGGLSQKLKGELSTSPRRPTSSRAHGLHIRVKRGGEIEFREKSAISSEVA